MVCGVHFRSDIEVSRHTAYLVFGYMMATQRFQRDLDAARIELRSVLGLPSQPALH
jgi:acid phosphatase (class A)